MSRLDQLLESSSCSQCGAGVYRNDEGRVACKGCDAPTEECTCTGGEKPDMSLPS